MQGGWRIKDSREISGTERHSPTTNDSGVLVSNDYFSKTSKHMFRRIYSVPRSRRFLLNVFILVFFGFFILVKKIIHIRSEPFGYSLCVILHTSGKPDFVSSTKRRSTMIQMQSLLSHARRRFREHGSSRKFFFAPMLRSFCVRSNDSGFNQINKDKEFCYLASLASLPDHDGLWLIFRHPRRLTSNKLLNFLILNTHR